MPEFDILHPEKHASLKVDTQFLLSNDAQKASTPVIPSEIEDAQKEFALVFKKHPDTGAFYTCALMGFSHDENLYLNNDSWQARFKPTNIARGPFMIGMQQKNDQPFPVIGIDSSHKAINTEHGSCLFKDNQPSEFTQKISALLADLHVGIEQDKEMIQAFLTYDLIEPFSCSFKFDDQPITLEHCYSINAQKLAALSGEALLDLNQKNILHLAFFIASSIQNLHHLASLKK